MLVKIKNILKWIILILSALIIIINVTLIVQAEIDKNSIPDFLGYTPFIVVSGSMEPNIPVNDIIITKKIKENNIKIGDVISYRDKENNIVITHRVVGIQNIDGQNFYETKGDSNKAPDKNLVAYSQIQGKYLFSIPLLGKVVNYVTTPRGMGLVLTFVICLYILYDIAAREHMRNKYKKARISQ